MAAAGTLEIADAKGFGGYVRELMLTAGVPTVEALAGRAGLSIPAVSNVVAGARPRYRAGTLIAIAKALGVDPGTVTWRATMAEPPDGWTAAAAIDTANRAPHQPLDRVMITIAVTGSDEARARARANLERYVAGMLQPEIAELGGVITVDPA